MTTKDTPFCMDIRMFFKVYQAPCRDPSIVAALKKEYQDFYKSIGISRTAEEAKNAFGSANPDKKRKQAVSFLIILLFCYGVYLILPL